MANPEHLEILKQGAGVWNKWRYENKDVIPDLNYADLNKADLTGALFGNARLHHSNLSYATLGYADLTHAILCSANLSYANLGGANISFADLTFADLYGTILREANLTGVNLTDAGLIYTDLGRATLINADLSYVRMGYTIFCDVDLSTAKNLESASHYGPSSIGIDTIYNSRGNIPEKFLRGCGVPEDFITYMRSLTGKAIEFYSCFISFTEADDALSERLYNDMQAAGVRCWRWKEDAKWGKTLMSSIDEAVRVYDKLVVVCSKQSLKSPAVIREIERALQKEDNAAHEGKEGEVLFPIRLDDFIFMGWEHHRKADIVAKNVGDFRRWTEPVEYKKAFERLMRDLKAGEKR